MNTLQEKIKELTFPYDMESINAEKALQKGILDLFEAEMLDIIGEDEKRIYSDSYDFDKPIGVWYEKEKRNDLRREQRNALMEKLGKTKTLHSAI